MSDKPTHINMKTLGEAADKGAEAYRRYLDRNNLQPNMDTARAFMVSDEGIEVYGSLTLYDIPNVACLLPLRV